MVGKRVTRAVLCLGILLLLSLSSYAQEYVLLGWNDLGMHCANQDFSKVAVLPPFNNITAQLILKQSGQLPQLVTSGFRVEYSIPNNTYSVGKTNFWTYAQQLFGLSSPLPDNIGLAGKGLTGTLDSAGNYFIAHGIPVTPFADSDLVHETPFQLIHLVAKKVSNDSIVATTDVVIPVSNEVGCVQLGCHASAAAILQFHEPVPNFNTNGPVLCASCHASNALGTTGNPEAGAFSYRIHATHAEAAGPRYSISTCYKCHPGPNTQCLRDIMGKNPTNPLICQNCHGTLDTVGLSVLNGRRPWLDEPKCGNCHGAAHAEETGKLYRMSSGHGGLFCSACHGSPHAIQPTVQPNDNLQNVRLQGYAGALRKCGACHGTPPTNPGPHGMMDTITSPPPVPVLLSPADGALNEPTTLTFVWQADTGVSRDHLQIATDTGFTALVFNDSMFYGMQKSVGPLLRGRTYYWHVQTKNIAGVSAWSTRWSFTTTNQLAAPVVVSPHNDAIQLPFDLPLRWLPSPEADLYRVQLSLDSTTFGTTMVDSLLSGTFVHLHGLAKKTDYFWRVNAQTTGGAIISPWSPVWKFTTGDSVICQEFAIDHGWDIVSMPITGPDHRRTTIFPFSMSNAFAYEHGTYITRDTLDCGKGYWLKFPNDTVLPVTGCTMMFDTIDISIGWNLIGSISVPVPVALITSEPGGMQTSEFFGFTSTYHPVDTILPGKGYWVKVNESGKLILSTGSFLTGDAKRIAIIPAKELPPPAPGSGEEERAFVVKEIPAQYGVLQNYPNPFNPSTTIRYALPVDGRVTLKVYNILGQEVATLVDGYQSAGYKTARFDASHLSSGIYFYRLSASGGSGDKAGSFTSVKKLLLLK